MSQIELVLGSDARRRRAGDRIRAHQNSLSRRAGDRRACAWRAAPVAECRTRSRYGFLALSPPALFSAALSTDWPRFRDDVRPIFALAVNLVLTTMLGVAVVAFAVMSHMSWDVAFVLGAVVSPPDAVATLAIVKRLNVPRQLVTILEGESLINDVTALVAYRTRWPRWSPDRFRSGMLGSISSTARRRLRDRRGRQPFHLLVHFELRGRPDDCQCRFVPHPGGRLFSGRTFSRLGRAGRRHRPGLCSRAARVNVSLPRPGFKRTWSGASSCS